MLYKNNLERNSRLLNLFTGFKKSDLQFLNHLISKRDHLLQSSIGKINAKLLISRQKKIWSRNSLFFSLVWSPTLELQQSKNEGKWSYVGSTLWNFEFRNNWNIKIRVICQRSVYHSKTGNGVLMASLQKPRNAGFWTSSFWSYLKTILSCNENYTKK